MARFNNSSYHEYLQNLSLPIQFFFFIVIVFLLLIFRWYMNFESKFEDLLSLFKICLMVFSVLLLLSVHWLSADDRERVPFHVSLPEDLIYRMGESPAGVALVLILLMLMISHHSSFKEKWFPLFTTR